MNPAQLRREARSIGWRGMLAWRLPRRVCYWVVIRFWADATNQNGGYPDRITVTELLDTICPGDTRP